MTQNHPINLSTTSDSNMGRFARLVLAIHLLSRVLRHASQFFSEGLLQIEESIQLDRTIHALIVLCELEGKRRSLRYCNPIDMCHRF